eukprot:977696-Prymnesium_polylepis.1
MLLTIGALLTLSFSQERPPIVELHRDNFDDTLASNDDVLVHFYAPCAHRLRPRTSAARASLARHCRPASAKGVTCRGLRFAQGASAA